MKYENLNDDHGKLYKMATDGSEQQVVPVNKHISVRWWG